MRQNLVQRLIRLDEKLVAASQPGRVDWTAVKNDLMVKIKKLRTSAAAMQVTAAVSFAFVFMLSAAKVIGDTAWPDLNKGALLIFLTLCYICSAFIQKMRLERLEQQLLLIDLLQAIDIPEERNQA